MRARNHEYGVEIQNIKYRIGSLESSMKEMKEVKSSMDAIAYLSKFIDGLRDNLIKNYLTERAEEKKVRDEYIKDLPKFGVIESPENVFDCPARRERFYNMRRIERIYMTCFGEPITDAILNDRAKGE